MATNTAPEKTEAEKREMLGQIIESASAAFLVSRNSADGLHGRPMATAKVEDDLRSLWFACQKDSHVAAEVGADPRVYLGYTNHTGSEWASINGLATVVTDRATIKQLWNPIWKNWFEGPDDPNIALLRVDPQDAEYWDSGSRAVLLLKLAFAAVTGKKVGDGEHEHVEMGLRFSEDQKRARIT